MIFLSQIDNTVITAFGLEMKVSHQANTYKQLFYKLFLYDLCSTFKSQSWLKSQHWNAAFMGM